MTHPISELQPSSLWSHFERLCAIPRPSKHEQRVSKYLADFGRSLRLDTTVDAVGNVIIRKPATPGMENRATICLQAHMDMVPQKNADVAHDFLNDPIRPRIDGEVVRATGTTLGADNGMGLSAILAILESKNIPHGPLEALITVDEEAGMTGAKNLQPGLLKAEYMLNLDSEDEEEICVGCAGGIDTTAHLPAPRENCPSGSSAFELKVFGLRGGHSGVDIGLGRGNSNILMARVLSEASAEHELRIAEINGGDLRNVIPRETRATVIVPKDKAEGFERRVREQAEALRIEFKAADPDIKVECKACGMPKDAIRPGESKRILSALYACPNGVAFMSPDMAGLVETSSNIGAVKTENQRVTLITLQRSSVDSRKLEMAHRLRSVIELAGGEATHANGYPGWNPNLQSPLLQLAVRVYEQKYGHKPKIMATHGGLECGILMGPYPKIQAISIGPTLKYPHSPDEHVYIASVKRFWDYFLDVLKQAPTH